MSFYLIHDIFQDKVETHLVKLGFYVDPRLFHLSFDLGVQCPYPYQCDMGTNSVVGNQ